MKRPRVALLAPLGIGIVSLVVVACGGSDPDPTTVSTRPPVPTATRSAPTATAQPSTAAPQPTAAPATAVAAPTTAGAPSSSRSFDWRIEDVDRGVKPSVALLSDGSPVIAYMLEDLQGFVKSATRTGGAWDISTVADGYFYGPLDIAIDPDDVRYIAYHDHQDTQFRSEKGDATVAVRRNGDWNVIAATDEGHDGWANRITIDFAGKPHMSGIDPVGFGGRGVEYYGVDESGQWFVEPVGSGPQDYKFATSVAVDPQGNPHVTFHEQTDGDLALASRGPDGWSIELIETEGQVGLFAYLVIDQDGRFHVSYLQTEGTSAGIVKYATRGAGEAGWSISEVGRLDDLSFGFIGARNITSLALDSERNPWIAYTDESVLKVAVRDGASWQTHTVVEAGDLEFGQLAVLKLDREDRPHVTYFEVTSKSPKLDGRVKYATSD